MPYQLPPQIIPSLLRSQHLVFETHEIQAILHQLTIQSNELIRSTDQHLPRHQCRPTHSQIHRPHRFNRSL